MIDKAIINSSPLIILSRTGHLPLLEFFAREIWIPGQVMGEILRYGPDDITVRSIAESSWLVAQPVQPIPASVLTFKIDAGESAVLAMGLSHPDTEVIIDDLAGRECANALGIPMRGTLSVVLAAKRGGIISKVAPIINDLLDEGLYLSDQIIEHALARAGE